MAKQDDPIVYHYTPVNKGDFVAGVPARDLTASEVDNLEPVQLHAISVPGASGTPMYTHARAVKRDADSAASKSAEPAKGAEKDGKA